MDDLNAKMHGQPQEGDRLTAMLLAMLVSFGPAPQAGTGDRLTAVVFVCEDGTAASFVAAAYSTSSPANAVSPPWPRSAV